MKERIATKQTNRVISIYRILILMAAVIQISGCGGHVYHVVEPGETLYSIGWLYGHDYRQIARWNKIASPYMLNKGQRLRVAPNLSDRSNGHAPVVSASSNGKRVTHDADDVKVTSRTSRHKSINSSDSERRNRGKQISLPRRQEVTTGVLDRAANWKWPVKGGKLVHQFNANDPGKRGIDLVGADGQPVYSAAAGRVVYSGQGLPRYGRLIIIKHDDVYLSAYGHNKRLLVKQGDLLKAGQHIADMGRNDANKTLLHFEIRRNGKPVDPLDYLSKRK